MEGRENNLRGPELYHGPQANHSLVLESSQKLPATSTLPAGHTLTELTNELSGGSACLL